MMTLDVCARLIILQFITSLRIEEISNGSPEMSPACWSICEIPAVLAGPLLITPCYKCKRHSRVNLTFTLWLNSQHENFFNALNVIKCMLFKSCFSNSLNKIRWLRQRVCNCQGNIWLTDWLGFNGIFSTNKLYRAFDKHVAAKKVKLMKKLTMLCVWNTYSKQLQQITLQSGLCRETLRYERYHESIVFPANHFANILTNKIKMTQKKIHNSINVNKHNKHNKLTLIWSYSYDTRSENEVAPFGDVKEISLHSL